MINKHVDNEDARPATAFEFHLPRGYVAADGAMHADGVMRLATAGDELSAAKDPRVVEQAAYLPVALLSRVVTNLGTLEAVTLEVIEGLFASDYAYLTRFYEQLNHRGGSAPVYRSVKLVLMNATNEKLVVQGFAAITGSWCEDLEPVQEMLVPAQSSVEWASVSTQAGCGTSAFVRLASSHGHTDVSWTLPWTGEFAVKIDKAPGITCTTTVDSSRPDAIAMVVTVMAGRE
ncbi:MAG: hypothetical protein ACXWCN_03645 [Caldimonas sp.]